MPNLRLHSCDVIATWLWVSLRHKLFILNYYLFVVIWFDIFPLYIYHSRTYIDGLFVQNQKYLLYHLVCLPTILYCIVEVPGRELIYKLK